MVLRSSPRGVRFLMTESPLYPGPSLAIYRDDAECGAFRRGVEFDARSGVPHGRVRPFHRKSTWLT